MKEIKHVLKSILRTKLFKKHRLRIVVCTALEKACFLYSVKAVNALKQAFSKAVQYSTYCVICKVHTQYSVV